jgi:hypothetical protein
MAFLCMPGSGFAPPVPIAVSPLSPANDAVDHATWNRTSLADTCLRVTPGPSFSRYALPGRSRRNRCGSPRGWGTCQSSLMVAIRTCGAKRMLWWKDYAHCCDVAGTLNQFACTAYRRQDGAKTAENVGGHHAASLARGAAPVHSARGLLRRRTGPGLASILPARTARLSVVLCVAGRVTCTCGQ